MHIQRQSRGILALSGCGIVMAGIFVADTLTDYAVAAAVFYTLVILAAVRLLPARTVVALACVCVALTALSFYLTPSGAYRVGLINSGISMLAIGIATYLALKMESAKSAAQQAQAQMLRLARISSLGELTASIAHEVNQPLAAIVTSGNACQRWLSQQPPNLDKAGLALERMLSDAHRASEIIARVRSLTRSEPPRRVRFDLNQAVQEVLDLSRAELERHGVAVVLRLDADLPAVLADGVQVRQVVGNLVLNAMESMAAGAAVGRELRVTSAPSEPGNIVCSIADTGAGLAPGMGEHLFDAFWTSKDGGVGLGLTISRNIIEANGGRIWAEPQPGGGARFHFSLPQARGDAS